MNDSTIRFNDDELNELSEFLRIAQQNLTFEADALARRHPHAATFQEQLRRWAERAADLRERIEGRD